MLLQKDKSALLDVCFARAYVRCVAICYRIAGHVKYAAKEGCGFSDLDTFSRCRGFLLRIPSASDESAAARKGRR